MLTAAKKTQSRAADQFGFPAAADAVIHRGALVVLNAGYAEPGSTATDLVAVGIAEEGIDNTGGADGAKTVPVKRGCFRFANEATDPVDLSHVSQPAYVVDDETVAASDGTGTRSAVGIIRDVDAGGVWVEL